VALSEFFRLQFASLKALPGCRMRRELRLPQWWMLLLAILAILSNQGSLLGMERCAQPQASA
jgi:hypothetical protein